MGRHERWSAGPARAAVPGTDGLPGWGAFASVVAAVAVAWTGHGWPPAAAVALLGLGCTALLWWLGCRARPAGEQSPDADGLDA
jgi:hypothetical protein